MQDNIAQTIAKLLREQKNKSVKSLFWNHDKGDLSVFARSHTPEVPRSFNYAPDADLSIEQIAEYIGKRCEILNKKQ